MGWKFVRVQPGDLVASDLFNRALDAIEDLDRRLSILEGAPAVGDVAILGLVPTTGAIRVGDVLKVLGFGFGVTLGVCRAFIDDTEVLQFLQGSNDSELNLVIPTAVAGPNPIPPAGRPVVLTVRGLKGSARKPLTLLPTPPADGPTTLLGFAGSDPIQPAQPARLRFSARSLVGADQTVTLTASFSGVVKPDDWASIVSFDSPAGTPLPGGRLTLKGNEPGKEFGVILAKVPQAGDANVTVTVTARADGGQVAGTSGEQVLPIGQPIPDIGIVLVGPTAQGGEVVGGVLTIAPGLAARVTYTATFTKVGTYQIQEPAATGAGWVASRSSDATVQGDPSPGGSKVLQYFVTAPAVGAADGSVTFPVANDAGTVDKTHRLTLRLKR